jgi:hypothetical protein
MSKEFNGVVVTDIKMPFGSMVVFMVKWAIATIPALIILAVIGSITFGVLNAIFGGFQLKMVM